MSKVADFLVCFLTGLVVGLLLLCGKIYDQINYKDLVLENEIMYEYIETFEQYETLDAAREAKDEVLEQIQFLYE